MPRTGTGRKKTRMEKIADSNNLAVTFSKRRFGIYSKATELSTLCGAQVAVLIFSPAGRMHTFGHPDFESVLYRFLSQNPHPVGQPTGGNADRLVEAYRQVEQQKLCSTLNRLNEMFHAEKERGDFLDKAINEIEGASFLGRKLEDMSLEEHKRFKDVLENTLKVVKEKADEIERQRLDPFPWAQRSSAGGSFPPN